MPAPLAIVVRHEEARCGGRRAASSSAASRSRGGRHLGGEIDDAAASARAAALLPHRHAAVQRRRCRREVRRRRRLRRWRWWWRRRWRWWFRWRRPRGRHLAGLLPLAPSQLAYAHVTIVIDHAVGAARRLEPLDRAGVPCLITGPPHAHAPPHERAPRRRHAVCGVRGGAPQPWRQEAEERRAARTADIREQLREARRALHQWRARDNAMACRAPVGVTHPHPHACKVTQWPSEMQRALTYSHQIAHPLSIPRARQTRHMHTTYTLHARL